MLAWTIRPSGARSKTVPCGNPARRALAPRDAAGRKAEALGSDVDKDDEDVVAGGGGGAGA